MPSFDQCIREAAEAGDIDPEAIAAAQRAYDDARATADQTLGPADADRHAAQAAMSALEAADIQARRVRALSIRARRNILEGVAEFKRQRGYTDVRDLGAGGGDRPPVDGWVQGGEPPTSGPNKGGGMMAKALELLIENRPGLSGAPFASVDGRYRAIRGQFDALMAGIIETAETKTGFDRPGRALLREVVREAFGEDTGHVQSKALASAWKEAAEQARQMFNAAGGMIAKKVDWGMPQYHDPLLLKKAGKEAWIAEVFPRLDPEKMLDRDTGLPMTPDRILAELADAWDAIVTRGASRRDMGESLGRGRLSDTRGQERFLAFKSADDWMAYAEKFGDGDPFSVMIGYLDELSRDIAQLQILGPNPQAQFKWLADAADREARMEGRTIKGVEDRAAANIRTARDMYDHFTGAANVPENGVLANFGATLRAYLVGTTLGSAIISDIPSAPVFGTYARTFSGLAKTPRFREFAALLASPEARANARRSGFVIEQATDGLVRGLQDNMRLVTVGSQAASGGNAFARILPSAIMRMQGLTGWTAARKRGFHLEFMGAIADRRGKTLAEMSAGGTGTADGVFAELLQARGLTATDWDRIRATPVWEPREGVSFIRPVDIVREVDQDLGYRVAELIELQTRLAVPETTLWTRAQLIGSDAPGTPWGEFKRSWAMYRSFSATVTYLYAEEFAIRGAKRGNGLMYGAGAAGAGLALLTLSGAAALQLRELTKGNDARDMTDKAFWAAALLQGGGLGIVGDFFYAAENRAGKSAAVSSYGPVGQLTADVSDLTMGNIDQTMKGKDAGVPTDLNKFASRYSPFSSLWWTRAAWDRAVTDNLQRLIDPDADAALAKEVEKLQKRTGQGMWWEPGSVLPERMPEISEREPAESALN